MAGWGLKYVLKGLPFAVSTHRYPVGMHLQGDLNFTSFINNCAISYSYNRAVALQGTSSMTISVSTSNQDSAGCTCSNTEAAEDCQSH